LKDIELAMPVKVVFISHDASRTGAPIVLLHLLKWIKQNTELEFLILMGNGGELEDKFSSLGKAFVWNKNFSTRRNKILNILNKFKILSTLKRLYPQLDHQYSIHKKIRQFQPDLIYANTVVSTALGVELSKTYNTPLICHVHELEVAINRYFGKENFAAVRYKVDHYIAVSEAVKQNLLLNHSIPEAKLNKVNAFIPAVEYACGNQSGVKYRKELSIPEEAIVVGGCGTIDWRKSPDLFIQVAGLVKRKNPEKEIFFVWVGGDFSSVEYTQLLHDTEKLGLKNVFILGQKEAPLEYFKMFDIFLLTSREDPYPLVCLEAAALSKPVLCFEGAGGMPEFVEKDSGFVAPFLDTAFMADKIIELAENKTLREQLGKNACKKVIEQHDIAVSSSRISEFIAMVVSAAKQQ
jgi:glycosyltransferase involved in cell wall biosynthesis